MGYPEHGQDAQSKVTKNSASSKIRTLMLINVFTFQSGTSQAI